MSEQDLRAVRCEARDRSDRKESRRSSKWEGRWRLRDRRQASPVEFVSFDSLRDVADPRVDVAEQAIENCERQLLFKHWSSLTPLQRRVLAWRFGVEDSGPRSYEQIAERLGWEVVEVKAFELDALTQLLAEYRLAG